VAVVRSRLGFFVPFVVVLALAGCGDGDDESDDQPTGQTSAPTSESSDPTPSVDPTATGDPTASSGSTVAPATGEPLELSNVSVHAPKGFDADPPDGSNLRFAFERGGIQSIALANTDSTNEALSLRNQARISITNNVYPRKPSVLGPVEVDGVEMYHYAGPVSDNEYVDEYGAIYDGSQISINFLLSATAAEAEHRELIDSVLATLTFS
jgi:hypothetical protein